jgi:hypothetical protein
MRIWCRRAPVTGRVNADLVSSGVTQTHFHRPNGAVIRAESPDMRHF